MPSVAPGLDPFNILLARPDEKSLAQWRIDDAIKYAGLDLSGHTKQRDRFYLEQRLSFSVKSMLVKVKKVGSRRYAYLVIGRRKGERPTQKTVFNLGPISKLVYGVPIDTRRKVRRPIRVDWDKIEDNIARIPLSFKELSEARHTEYFLPSWARPKRFRPQDPKPRPPGELSALIKLAAKKFDEMFEEIGDREYRMR